MKHLIRLVVIIALVSFVCAALSGCAGQKGEGTAFYVSPSGNDSWSGKLPEPNKRGADGPFATLEKARDAVRALKKTGALPDSGITALIRGGKYQLPGTFKLAAEDSGVKGAPIVWSAFPGESVHFIGGKVIGGFGPVTDQAVLGRIESQFQDKILMTDLKAQGITVYGEFTQSKGPGMELFFKGEPMKIARFPNEGWVTIKSVPQAGDSLINEGDPLWMVNGKHPGRHYGRFAYDSDRPKRWAQADDIWMHGYWVWDWRDEYQKIQKIDLDKGEIYLAKPYHGYGYQEGQRYYYLNILDELDSPGEYYIDRTNGILYFWPPSDIGEGDAFVSILADVMVSFDGASYITMERIIFEGSSGNSVKISDCTGVKVAGCTMRNLGGNAVDITGGTNNGVVSCDIYNVEAGINVGGGDRKTLTPAGNYAENNHVHHYSRIIRTYNSAVGIDGVGNRLSHNYIHHAPHQGVGFGGNDHIIEYNEIHDIALETGDVGALYSCGDWTFYGNLIQYNYFHDIHGPGKIGSMCVYQDLPVSGSTIYSNVFCNVERAVNIHSGRDNIVENNLFIQSFPSVSIGVWPFDQYYKLGGPWQMVERLEAMNYKNPPYSTKYPKLLKLFEDGLYPGMAAYNTIIYNVSYGGRWLNFSHQLDFDIVSVKENLIADPEILKLGQKDKKPAKVYKNSDKEIRAILEKFGNVVLDGDPGFVDVASRNFNLKDDSPAWKIGFKPIPFDKIGLYADEYRKSLH